MDELRALLATGHIVAMRQKGECYEIVTAHSEDGADEQPLRLTVITGLIPTWTTRSSRASLRRWRKQFAVRRRWQRCRTNGHAPAQQKHLGPRSGLTAGRDAAPVASSTAALGFETGAAWRDSRAGTGNRDSYQWPRA